MNDNEVRIEQVELMKLTAQGTDPNVVRGLAAIRATKADWQQPSTRIEADHLLNFQTIMENYKKKFPVSRDEIYIRPKIDESTVHDLAINSTLTVPFFLGFEAVDTQAGMKLMSAVVQRIDLMAKQTATFLIRNAQRRGEKKNVVHETLSLYNQSIPALQKFYNLCWLKRSSILVQQFLEKCQKEDLMKVNVKMETATPTRLESKMAKK